MISHKHKCIFIHIPKTAGMSINSFFHPEVNFYQDVPNYEILFGWCPKRQLHMQHATAKQLLETELITEEQWNDYYKFTFVRNPWDRAYSDYKWIQGFSGIYGGFKDFINKAGDFDQILNNKSSMNYLGDHLQLQTDFFDFEGFYKPDFIGRFENFPKDILKILKDLEIKKSFDIFINTSKREKDYSLFYTNTFMHLISKKYYLDIELLNYQFEDKRKGIYKLKQFL